MEKTLAIIKPDAVARGLTGDILKRIEAAGLSIRAIRKLHLTRAQAELSTRFTRRGRFMPTCANI